MNKDKSVTDGMAGRLSVRDKVAYGLAIGCMTAATAAIFVGMLIEPRGEVHGSVLTYFGISSAFCGSLLGISAHYSSEMSRFKAEIMNIMPGKDGVRGI